MPAARTPTGQFACASSSTPTVLALASSGASVFETRSPHPTDRSHADWLASSRRARASLARVLRPTVTAGSLRRGWRKPVQQGMVRVHPGTKFISARPFRYGWLRAIFAERQSVKRGAREPIAFPNTSRPVQGCRLAHHQTARGKPGVPRCQRRPPSPPRSGGGGWLRPS